MTVNVQQANLRPPDQARRVRWKLAMIAAMALLAMVWSGYLAAASMQWITLALCSSGSCTQYVLTTHWSQWLGVPVGVLGMCLYGGVLAALVFTGSSVLERRRAAWSVLLVLAMLVMGAALWFLGLMTLHLHKSCGHCASLHMLGMIISYLIITSAPLGRAPSALLGPGRVVGLAAVSVLMLTMLIGVQLLTALASEPPASSEQKPAADQTAAPVHEPEAAIPSSAAETPVKEEWGDPNTPEGKATTEATLKRLYGNRWDKMTEMCQVMPYFASRPGVHQTPTGLLYEVLSPGIGQMPPKRERARIHVQGKLWTGEVFQNTFAAGRPLDVRLSELIPGLAEALVMMPEGSRWRLLVAPGLGFQAAGLPGVIPPDTPVYYEVELLETLPASIAHAGDSSGPVSTRNQEGR